ncbi:BF3164 family lipoprotein [Algoriphagus aquimarinus]|uniref:TolB-like 6-blade propeller-like n=1 Tax=Algoriphagus aquimarinus TaxID=237018 RepID=A0A1I1BDL9_9BACT|nr:BF3164 family lipoprotein [Algoriphagus aquimarinus]SFB48197.1 TolB-like 6-blade propeller-like [Algoriphagus aquimarinus]
MKRSLFSFLIALIVLGCSTSDKKNPFDLSDQEIYYLNSKKIYYPELINPMKINKVGDYLIISENPRISPDQPLLHVLGINNLNYLYPKGITGFGPLEISNATLIEEGFTDSTFLNYSSQSKRFSEFSLTNNSRLAISEYKQPDDLYMVYLSYHATDSTIIGLMANDLNRLAEYSIKDGKRIAGYGTWEKIPETEMLIDYEDPLINYHLGELNKGWFKANRALGLFVKASIYRDRLEIFHFDTKKFDIVEGPRVELPDFNIWHSNGQSAVIFNPENAYGHRDIAIGEKYIYDLYGGFNQAHINEINEIAKTIYILTHDGDVVGKLNLDVSLRSLEVDEKLGEIYGITTDEDPGIAVFDIPDKFL